MLYVICSMPVKCIRATIIGTPFGFTKGKLIQLSSFGFFFVFKLVSNFYVHFVLWAVMARVCLILQPSLIELKLTPQAFLPPGGSG